MVLTSLIKQGCITSLKCLFQITTPQPKFDINLFLMIFCCLQSLIQFLNGFGVLFSVKEFTTLLN